MVESKCQGHSTVLPSAVDQERALGPVLLAVTEETQFIAIYCVGSNNDAG